MMRRLLLIVALVALLPHSAFATARFVQGTIGTSGTTLTTSCTVAATVSGNTLIVLFASDGTETVSSITDTNADTFTVVNNVYTQSTNQKGGYATAVATASNTTITLTWSNSGANNHYESCAEVMGTATCTAGACVDTAQGLGCVAGVACGPTSGFGATQNDELVFSQLTTNTAVTTNSQTSSDSNSCKTSSSSCGGNVWGAGAISTAHVASYYRNVLNGGTISCNWTSWVTTSISGVSCLAIKSASNSSATFLQGGIAAQNSATCAFPSAANVGTLLVVLFAASNNTDTVTGISDASSDTFSIVNTLFFGGTSSSGGYATAISGGTGNAGVTITWTGAGNHTAACYEITNFVSCGSHACVDVGSAGHGCTTSAALCNTSGQAWTAQQNDEIVLSLVMNNGTATINTQTSADTGACTSSAPTTGTCAVTKWNSVGSASTVHDAAYYRNITGGGSQTCNWTWTTSTIASVLCIGIKSGVTFAGGACSMGLLGVGCHDDADEEHDY